MTSRQLASKARIAERYSREWLEQQAVAGFVTIDSASGSPDDRVFRLPFEYAGILVEEDDSAHVTPFAHMVVGIAKVLPEVVHAYRTGGGVAYHMYGPDFRHGQSGINRPAFLHDLTASWLPAIPNLHERLKAGPGVRIADVGCGGGWSAIALARAYPHALVAGYDLDEASVADAQRNAAERGVKGALRL